jgi:ubiquinone/menaquinone biosynthesis C-methylase UbiE
MRSFQTDIHPRLPGAHEAHEPSPAVPAYLAATYWWAYVHPHAVRFFEREWLVNLILFGNYKRLRDRALAALGEPITGHTLQVACVYGNLTRQLLARMRADARLDVVDILPIQLHNLSNKAGHDARLSLVCGDASALPQAEATYDQVLLFFLLHEQPENIRRATLREALRVVKPGGRVVMVDYHRPQPMHPLRPLMRSVFQHLEPFAKDLWDHPLQDYLPHDFAARPLRHETLFGGLYQLLVLER